MRRIIVSEFIVPWIVLWFTAAKLVKTNEEFILNINPNSKKVYAGSTVHLRCTRDKASHLITFSYQAGKGGVIIVKNSTLVRDPSKYTYSNESGAVVSHLLTINSIDHNDDGLYYCIEGNSFLKQLELIVLYAPQGTPQCSINYGEVCFEELVQQTLFMFNCVTTDSHPKANVTLLLDNKPLILNVTTNNQESVGNNAKITKSFSSYLNVSYNNSFFYCYVTHNKYAPYINYSESCRSGPLIISSCPESFETSSFWTKNWDITEESPTDTNWTFVLLQIIVILGSIGFIFLFTLLFIVIRLAQRNSKCSNFENKSCRIDHPIVSLEHTANTTKGNSSVNEFSGPTGNEGCLSGMGMMDNVNMVPDIIYEPVNDGKVYRSETLVYAAIERL